MPKQKTRPRTDKRFQVCASHAEWERMIEAAREHYDGNMSMLIRVAFRTWDRRWEKRD